MKKTLVLVAVLLSFVSCSKFETATPQLPAGRVDFEEQMKKDEFHRDTEVFSTEIARPYDVVEYSLKGHYDWSRSRLMANVTITLEREAGVRTIELDSVVTQVSKVALATGEDLPFTVNAAAQNLTFDLPATMTGSTVVVRIDYEVMAGSQADERRRNLNLILPRLGDPVQSRVIYTRSEPRGAHAWMPCNDRPADGARFSIELTMPSMERMISNGRLLRDDVVGAERTMAYRTDKPQPTYLMAFAQGDFVTATRQHGSLPVSVWARRGLQVAWDSILDETVREIALFEKLLTPYPYEKYVIVLLPEFGGGMEHASITFNEELRSSQPLRGDFALMAHELGHHWFGDYITVKHWDDLWVKEGMATLLSAEAMRTFEDEKQTGLLMGEIFGVRNGDAVRDPALAPEAKYTSGPYGRAAWLYTQIRSMIGEKAFWGALRSVLLAHEYSAVTSEDVLEAFRPYLGEARYAKTLASLSAHEFPQLQVSVVDDVLTLTLEDKENALLSPLEIVTVGAAGQQSRQALVAGASVSLTRQPGMLVSLDPRDVHPAFATWIRGTDAEAVRKTMDQSLAKLVTPVDATELALFTTLNPSSQLVAMTAPDGWASLTPADFMQMRGEMSSVTARFASMSLACARARAAQDPADQAAWTELLSEIMLNPDFLGLHTQTGAMLFSNCRGVVPPVLMTRLAMVEKQAAATWIGDAELAYLSYLPVDGVVTTWSPLAETGRSLRARMIALDAIANRANLGGQKGPGVETAKAMGAFGQA